MSSENELYKLKAKIQEMTEKNNQQEGKYSNASIRLYKPQNQIGKHEWLLGIFLKVKDAENQKQNIQQRSKNFGQYCIRRCSPDSTVEEISHYIEGLKSDLDDALTHYIEHLNDC